MNPEQNFLREVHMKQAKKDAQYYRDNARKYIDIAETLEDVGDLKGSDKYILRAINSLKSAHCRVSHAEDQMRECEYLMSKAKN